MTPTTEDSPRQQLGHYTLLEQVSHGNLGIAYRARDTILGRTVLVTDAHGRIGNDPATRGRFATAARATATVSHPNVAALFAVEEGPDRLFLVSEFVPGQTLDDGLGGRPLGVRQAVSVGIQLAEALGAGHAAGVLHLDVQPASIKLNRRGHAKLLDMGLAEWTASQPRSKSGVQPTVAPINEASPYQSPELHGGEPLDARSDIFSLGVVLHEILTGRAPVGGADGQTAPRPSAANPEVPPELDAIVGRATARCAADRYQSVAPLAAELRSLAAILDVRSGDLDPPVYFDGAAHDSVRSTRHLLPLTAVAVTVVAVGLWWWLGY